uniref:Uncharacterized protein n=1 Tax=Romanomermis culicivorax TaxID=13658 RepID=A0A915K0M6_ROMCU
MPATSIGERSGPSNRRSVHVNPISRGITKTMVTVHPTSAASAAPTTIISATPPSTVVVDPLPQPIPHFAPIPTTTLIQPQNVVSTSTPSAVAILQQSAVPLAFVTPNQETLAPLEEYDEPALPDNQMQTISSSSITRGYPTAGALPPQNFSFSTNVTAQQQRDDDQPSTSTS